MKKYIFTKDVSDLKNIVRDLDFLEERNKKRGKYPIFSIQYKNTLFHKDYFFSFSDFLNYKMKEKLINSKSEKMQNCEKEFFHENKRINKKLSINFGLFDESELMDYENNLGFIPFRKS